MAFSVAEEDEAYEDHEDVVQEVEEWWGDVRYLYWR